MKKITLILGIVALASCSSNSTNSQAAKTTEPAQNSVSTSAIPVAHGKDFIKSQMEESYVNLAKAVKGLTKEQIAFKPAADKWSIGETLEHIVKTEPALLGWVQNVMSEPANPQDRKDIKMTDDQVLVTMTDRSYKATAPKELTPVGTYTEASTALTDLSAQRKAFFTYLDGVSMEDLRNHVAESPGGKVDGYQFLLYIPGHTMRHTLQILEIKQNPNFPKN